MKTQRGRQSSAAKAVLTLVPPGAISRPSPPNDLDGEEAEEWTAVVDRMPIDWFGRETHALLTQYCRHVVSARQIAKLIRAELASAESDVEDLDRLLKMQEREGRSISSLATRMRLTQQATYSKEKKKTRSSGHKLYQFSGDR